MELSPSFYEYEDELDEDVDLTPEQENASELIEGYQLLSPWLEYALVVAYAAVGKETAQKIVERVMFVADDVSFLSGHLPLDPQGRLVVIVERGEASHVDQTVVTLLRQAAMAMIGGTQHSFTETPLKDVPNGEDYSSLAEKQVRWWLPCSYSPVMDEFGFCDSCPIL